MSCEKITFFPFEFENTTLCNKCGRSVDACKWIERNFSSMEVLMNQKAEVIQKASNVNMSQSVIDKISTYFDDYIDANFITFKDGKVGQKLKVFSDFCIINTDSLQSKEKLIDELYKTIEDMDEDEDFDDLEVFSTSDKMNIASGLMSGRIVQTGVGAIATAIIKNKEKEKIEMQRAAEYSKKEKTIKDNLDRLVALGERRLAFDQFSNVEICIKRNSRIGFLKFLKVDSNTNTLLDYEYFFFSNTRKLKKEIEQLKLTISHKIATIRSQKASDTIQNETTHNFIKQDVFDEVRCFKQLMDEGIITAEDFDKKKKELLNL